MFHALSDVLLVGHEGHHASHLVLVVSDEAVADGPFAVLRRPRLNQLNEIVEIQMRSYLNIRCVHTPSVGAREPDGCFFGNSHYSAISLLALILLSIPRIRHSMLIESYECRGL